MVSFNSGSFGVFGQKKKKIGEQAAGSVTGAATVPPLPDQEAESDPVKQPIITNHTGVGTGSANPNPRIAGSRDGVGNRTGHSSGDFDYSDGKVSVRPPTGTGNRTGHESGNFELEDDGTGRVSPGSPGGEPQPEKSIEELVEEMVRDRLAGANSVDTSEEDALIRELMQQEIGGGRVGNRAAMGARGFAESGAALAMGSDIERAARQSAIEQMLGVRQREEEQAHREAMDAGGLDIDYGQNATEQAEAEARIALLESLLNPDGDPPPPPSGGNGGDVPPPDVPFGDDENVDVNPISEDEVDDRNRSSASPIDNLKPENILAWLMGMR